MNKHKEVLKNSLAFVLMTVLPKIIVVLILPLYTSRLTTDEYGTYDLIHNVVSLLMPILTLQIQDAILRFGLDKSCEKKIVFTFGIKVIVSGTLVLIILYFTGCLAGLIKYHLGYFLYIVLAFFFGALYNTFTYYLRAEEKIKILGYATLLNTLSTVCFSVISLVVFSFGLYGFLAASVVGPMLADFYMFFRASLYTKINFRLKNMKVEKELLVFSIPMIFSALSWWINNSSDKFILNYIAGTSIVGIYAISYKIPSIISTISVALSKGHSITTIKEFDADDKDGFLTSSITISGIMGIIACSFMLIMNIFIAKILFSKEFYEAWRFVPPLMIAAVLDYWAGICLNLILALKETKVSGYSMFLGAATNTVFNLLLIPQFGALGAAISTMIGFGIGFFIRFHFVIRRIRLELKILKLTTSFLLLLLQTFIALMGNELISIQIGIFIILIFGFRVEILEYLLTVFNKD